MRTTLDIDDDVLAAARERARLQGQSIGTVASALMRQALLGSGDRPAEAGASTGNGAAARTVGGFRPFASRGRVVSNDQIDTLRDAEGV